MYIDSRDWEGQFLEISGHGLKSKLLLANIYHPPRDLLCLENFIGAFVPIINTLALEYRNMIISGDLNINFLNIDSNQVFKEYFDSLTNCGLLPVITYPTHFSDYNGTIIDHIYVKVNNCMSNIYAGISMHLFSKHHPTFISISVKNEIKKLPK